MKESLRIVVADDEPDMREYFQRLLPRLGHQVVGVAATGRELIAVCRGTRPDLVLTDIKMPEMDGIEAANEVCRERRVPVVLVSAHHEADLVERAKANYILGYLLKPIRQNDLAAIVDHAWKRSQESGQPCQVSAQPCSSA
jgi:response regulator NasT